MIDKDGKKRTFVDDFLEGQVIPRVAGFGDLMKKGAEHGYPDFMRNLFVTFYCTNAETHFRFPGPGEGLGDPKERMFFEHMLESYVIATTRDKTVRNAKLSIMTLLEQGETILRGFLDVQSKKLPLEFLDTSLFTAIGATVDEIEEILDLIDAKSVVPGVMPYSREMDLPSNDILAKAKKLLRDGKGVASTILKLAGRFKGIVSKMKSGKFSGGRATPHRFSLGGDISAAVPAELGIAKVSRLLFLANLAESGVLQDEADTSPRDGNGDIVFLVDESGSMDGPYIRWAKAMAIAIMNEGIKKGRSMRYYPFDTKLGKEITGAYNIAKKTLSGGGTDISRAFSQLATELEAKIKNGSVNPDTTDIIMITDGCGAPSREPEKWNRLRKTVGMRALTVVIAESRGSLAFPDERVKTAAHSSCSAFVDRIVFIDPKVEAIEERANREIIDWFITGKGQS